MVTQNDFWLSTNDLAAWLGKKPIDLIKEIELKFGKQRQKSLLPPSIVRRYLSSLDFQVPYKVVSFQMLKGGVAKTTSALQFGRRAAMYGARVLFVDLDQQANLTFALGVDAEDKPVWIDVFEKKLSLKDVRLQVEEGIDLIPSSLNNSVLDRSLLNSARNWSQAVKSPLQEIREQYDLVIIDTAPNLSATNTAVTCASDEVVLPITPDKFSLLGLRKHLEDLQELKKEFSLAFSERILFTKYDARESASRDFLSQCIDTFEDRLLKHYIRTSADIKNSIGTRNLFATKSNAKEDYDLVTKELMGFI